MAVFEGQSTVRLETNEGAYVGEVGIPKFAMPPDVVIFGTRVFVRPSVMPPKPTVPGYREAFCYVIPVPAPADTPEPSKSS